LTEHGSRKYPQPTTGGLLEIPRGRKDSKVEILKRKVGTSRGMGLLVKPTKSLQERCMDIFWNNTKIWRQHSSILS